MAYILSSNITIYPTAYRYYTDSSSTVVENPEAKLNTEYNITNSLRSLLTVNNSCFIIKYDGTNHKLDVCLGGYIAQIENVNWLSGSSDIYLHLFTHKFADDTDYKNLIELVPSTYPTGTNPRQLDDGTYFLAITHDNTESITGATYTLKVWDGETERIPSSSYLKFSLDDINGDENSLIPASEYLNLNTLKVGDITTTGKVSFANLGATGISGVTTKSLAIDTQNSVKSIDLTTSSPTKNGTSLEFIDTISQNSYGKISATKKEITIAAGSNQGAIKINGSDYYINGVGINNIPSFYGITTNIISPNGSGVSLNLGSGNSKYTSVYNNSIYGNGYLVTTVNKSAVGSNTKPVYVNSSGNIVASTSTVGSTTQPVYLSGGTLTSGDQYAGGTKVTTDGVYKSELNINSHSSGTTNTIYAPTTSGMAGQVLVSGGNLGTPVWSYPLPHLYEHRFRWVSTGDTYPTFRIYFTLFTTDASSYTSSSKSYIENIAAVALKMNNLGINNYDNALQVGCASSYNIAGIHYVRVSVGGVWYDSIELLRQNSNNRTYMAEYSNGAINETVRQIF